MTAVALKRGARPPRQKAAAKRAPATETLALPVSARTLRRNIVISFAVLATAAAIIVTSLMGLPQRWWSEFVIATAEAGFEVRHVEVSGTKEMARLPVYDAALAGTSNAMLTADLPAIRARLLQLPWVADASVGRRLPDTLSISIVERKPVALWQHRGQFRAIDITGQPLTAERLERFKALPLVVGPGANRRVRELLALTAAAPALSDRVDAAILVGGRRWDVRFKSGETLALPDTLSISIVERKPVALWQHRGQFRAIDITGQPLTAERLERFKSLPLVVGPGANRRVRELLALTAAAPALSDRVDAAILVGGRRWDVRFKSGETLALPDTPAAATAAFKRFAKLEASLGEDRKLLGGRFARFDMRLPGRMTVAGPAVAEALAEASKAAQQKKPTTI